MQCRVGLNETLRAGESLYRIAEVANGTEAVDVCLVVSAVASMTNSHRWLQIMVPVLDGHLLTLGIGTGERKNRYCLVMFGGERSASNARFLRVDGQIFFAFQQFAYARRQLRRIGTVADGYEAIKFTALNAPFRESPGVWKMILLVTDRGRDVLASEVNLTRTAVLHEVYFRNIVLDSIVSIRLELQGASITDYILGFHGYDKASLILPRGSYEISSNHTILFSYTKGQTLTDYVALSLAGNGSSWCLGILNREDYNTLVSFANIFTAVHSISPGVSWEVCEHCQCGQDMQLVCEQPSNQTLCSCLTERDEANVSSLCRVVASLGILMWLH